MAAGIGAEPRGAVGKGLCCGGVLLLRRRRRAHHDGEIIEQPVRPGEFEEGIDEDNGEPHHLHLPQFRRLCDAKRQRGHDSQYLLGRAQQRERAADGDQAGGGEESGAVLQRGGDLRIHHAHVARQKALHPFIAIGIHQRVEAAAALGGLLDQQRIADPSAEEPGEGEQVEWGVGRHGHDSETAWCPLSSRATTSISLSGGGGSATITTRHSGTPRKRGPRIQKKKQYAFLVSGFASCRSRPGMANTPGAPMPQNITTGYRALVDAANSEVETLPTEQAIKLAGRDDVVLVDIRDIRELQREGRVPGAFHCPRGLLEFWIDPQSPYHKPKFAEDKRFVFFCAGGLRSALAAQTAQRMGLKPVAHIEGGFGAWKKLGGPVEPPDTMPGAPKKA